MLIGETLYSLTEIALTLKGSHRGSQSEHPSTNTVCRLVGFYSEIFTFTLFYSFLSCLLLWNCLWLRRQPLTQVLLQGWMFKGETKVTLSCLCFVETNGLFHTFVSWCWYNRKLKCEFWKLEISLWKSPKVLSQQNSVMMYKWLSVHSAASI